MTMTAPSAVDWIATGTQARLPNRTMGHSDDETPMPASVIFIRSDVGGGQA